ncbi:SDR family oxidoreductase [Mucilaginibacter sp.]|uniref:SDR family oxidoreductase n=1 Tax=Mucilaginibacter sp. TaxID=1882438 RepID=UPI003B00DA59
MNTEILITGATGTIGSEICRQLSKLKIPFKAMSRSAKDAKPIAELEGAEIIIADFNDPESLKNALKGIRQAFLLTSSSEKTEQLQLNFVAAAKKAGLEHLVKLSQLHADENSPVRFLRYHAVVENAIKDAKINYTFLRPNLFMQGLLGFKDPIIYQSKFFATVGNAKISLIDIRDIASVAVECLQGNTHYNKTYDLTGPESLTHYEIADKFSDALSKKVEYVNVDDKQMVSALRSAGFPDWQADGLIEDYAHYARGEAEKVSNNVLEITGNEPRSFDSFLSEYLQKFKISHS